jgi:hypothetical protein
VPDEHQQTTPPDQLTQAPSPAEDAPDAAAQESAEARRKREQWERDHAQWLRERDETRRELFTLFKIWTICPHKNCQRARACRALMPTQAGIQGPNVKGSRSPPWAPSCAGVR